MYLDIPEGCIGTYAKVFEQSESKMKLSPYLTKDVLGD
jgi:hypothetical protein